MINVPHVFYVVEIFCVGIPDRVQCHFPRIQRARRALRGGNLLHRDTWPRAVSLPKNPTCPTCPTWC